MWPPCGLPARTSERIIRFADSGAALCVDTVQSPHREDLTMSDPTACSESGCSCKGYSQPDTGTACKTCGHYSGKHTG